MDKNYIPGILLLVVGLILLLVSYSGDSEYRLVIRGTHISYGWFLVGLGVVKVIAPPDSD